MSFKRNKQNEDVVGDKYTDLVTTTEVKKFYEIWKKCSQETGEEIYKHFGAINPENGSVYQLDYEVVDLWYNKHIVGTGLENDLLKSWIMETLTPYHWVSFMIEKIGVFLWKEKKEEEEREKQLSDMGVV